MTIRQSTVRKFGTGVLVVLFVAAWALPDVFAAGLGSAGKRGGSSSPSTPMDRGGGIGGPTISEKSSSIPSGSSSIPSGSSLPSSTPMSIPSESQTSYKTYTPPDSVDTSTSSEGPTGSVGSEAAAGSKKKKASSGGFPPVDNTTVTGSREPDTAMAIRGKPAHSERPGEGTHTKGSDVTGVGSSKESGGIGGVIEKSGHDVMEEAERLRKTLWEQPIGLGYPGGPGTPSYNLFSVKDIFNEGKRLPGNVENIPKHGQQLYDDIQKAGQDVSKEIERVPGSLKEKLGTDRIRDEVTAPTARAIEAEYGRSRDQLGRAEDKAGAIIGDALDKGAKQLEDAGNEVQRAPKNIERAINETGLTKLPDTMQPGHLFEEGRRSFGNTPLGRGLKDAGGTLERGAKQLEGAGKKLGGTIGKAGKEFGDAVSDAGDQAGGVLSDAQDAAQGVVSGAQDAAEDGADQGQNAAEEGCDAVAGVFGGNC